MLVDLSRDAAVGRHLVTTAPDVATSTNLAGFINRTGVYNPTERRAWNEDPVLKWAEGPTGQHIELGISEMNLFLLLGQLGLSWDLSGQPLLPVGTVYDPFVCRGLDAFIHAVYSGSRFVVAGTPSGVTLAPEGGAHQSTITASIGLELPGVTFIEPAYAARARLAAVRRVRPDRRRSAGGAHGGSARRRRLLLPAVDAAGRPGAVRGGAGAARRRGAAPPGAGRRATAWSTPPTLADDGCAGGAPRRRRARSCPRS